MKTMTVPATLAALLTLGLAAGCGETPPGAGLTNGPAPDMVDEKPAVRSDLPVADAPDEGEILGEVGDYTNDAGSAARGGGAEGAPNPDTGSTDPVRATPTAIEAGGPAPPEEATP